MQILNNFKHEDQIVNKIKKIQRMKAISRAASEIS